MPIHFSPKGGTGFTLYGDFGKGLNEESGENTKYVWVLSLAKYNGLGKTEILNLSTSSHLIIGKVNG